MGPLIKRTLLTTEPAASVDKGAPGDQKAAMSLSEIARHNLAIVEAGRYETNGVIVDLQPGLARALERTTLYRPEQLENLLGSATPAAPESNELPGGLHVEVTDERTGAAARRLFEAGGQPPLVLNFASARNPGGGFLRGAKAQEEDLCRCSALYSCQLRCPEYYEVNRRERSLLYT